MKNLTLITTAVLAVLIAVPAMAQGPERGRGGRGGRGQGPPAGMREGGPGEGMDSGLQHSIKRYLYLLHLVRKFATELELTDKQIKKLQKVSTDVQTEVERLKWDLTSQTRKLVELVRDGASKDKIYAQLDVIFKYENKIKKKKMGLMIVIRDILTAEQRAYLDEVKESHFKQKKWNKKMKKMKMKKGKRGGPKAPF